jgi:hypothetical protein
MVSRTRGARRASREAQEVVSQIKVEEEERRREVLREFGHQGIRETTRAWWRDEAEQRITEWIRSYFYTSRAELGLSADQATWPEPRNLPAAWNGYAYKMARMVQSVGEQRKIAASDFFDFHHYVAAGYTEVLVTEDAAFRSTCASIPTTTARIQSLREFMASFPG